MKRSCLYGSMILTLLFTSLIPVTVGAEPTHNGSKSPVPYNSLTPRVEWTIERTAVVALRHVSRAREAIHRSALADARRELAEAARLMTDIRDDLSTSIPRDLIGVARSHLAYEPPQSVLEELPRINASLNRISTYLPTDRARDHLGRAREYLEKDDKRDADRELVLADKSLIVIEVELPLLRSERLVTEAQRLLAEQNAAKADEALRKAEARMSALYAGLNSPLSRARQDLWLAFRNYSSAREAEARTYLERARVNLERAAANGTAWEKDELGALSANLTGLERELKRGGTVADSALKSTWERSVALAERSVALFSGDIAEAETTLSVERRLIEARLHVAFAETYQVTTSEPKKADGELDLALSQLRNAARSELAGPKARGELAAIEKAIVALKSVKRDATAEKGYEEIKEELSGLIQEL